MPDDKKPPEPKIPGDIGASEFNSWKRHPVTVAYLNYLKAQREDVRLAALDGWEGGKLSLAVADEMRGCANTLKKDSEPDFAEIVTFYAEIDEMKKQEKIENEQAVRPTGDPGKV